LQSVQKAKPAHGKTKMFKKPNKHVLLFILVVFAFLYRIMLILWQQFPTGADIGLHNSIINSITTPENTNLLWNYHHMGGRVSLTFPGYHLFVAYILLLTGMPDYLAHALVAAFFSSLTVLGAYLLTRTIGSESVALITAFLVTISRFDIEMLLWGGYPNVITLMLIPLTFYVFLQRARFSSHSFFVTSTFLCGAIFFTHSLSVVVFASVTFATIILFLFYFRNIGFLKTQLLVWVLPLILGTVLISPFLLQLVPAYLGANSGAFPEAAEAIRLGLISTKVFPLDLFLPLLVSIPLFFIFSRIYKGKFLTVPAVLLAMLILIPAVSTQGYLIGLYTYYNRFLYFILLPMIILVAFGVDYGACFFSRITSNYISSQKNSSLKRDVNKTLWKLKPHFTNKNVFLVFVLAFLLFASLVVPVLQPRQHAIFLRPQHGIIISTFYQVMNPLGYDGINWIRQQTPSDSIFVSDAHYGWWISGFAQRSTFSAVKPQYLILPYEFEPARIAGYLLDANYVLDNGLIQVKEDGGYVSRHNPIFSAKIRDIYEAYPVFHFNNSDVTVFYRKDGNLDSFDLSQVPVKEMRIEIESNYASIIMNREGQFFNFSHETTVYRGVRFVNVSIKVESNIEEVSVDWIRLILHIDAEVAREDIIQKDNTVALIDKSMMLAPDGWQMRSVLGQLIFPEDQPSVRAITRGKPSALELLYNLEGKPGGKLSFYVGTYQIRPEETEPVALNTIMDENLNYYLDKITDLPIEVFDYKKALRMHEISYIACRDSEIIPKFANDSTFSIVFSNDEIAIFAVKRK
jgi:hypothetical protein